MEILETFYIESIQLNIQSFLNNNADLVRTIENISHYFSQGNKNSELIRNGFYASVIRNLLPPVDLRVIRFLMLHTFIPKFTHINLQGEQCKNHQAENRQRHYFGKLLEAV